MNIWNISKTNTARPVSAAPFLMRHARTHAPPDQNAWGYVTLISEGRFKEAIAVIKEANPFPAVLGRVCVHPCETKCRRAQIDEPVSICAFKRFAADTDMSLISPSTDPR